MKKSICVVSLVSLLSLTACGGGSSGGANTAPDNNAANPVPTLPGNGNGPGTIVSDNEAYNPANPAAPEQPPVNLGEEPAPIGEGLIARDDAYVVTANQAFEVPIETGLMSNDAVDPQGGQVALAKQPANGTLILELNGSFSYTPDDNFFGTDSFEYTVMDEAGDQAKATVSLKVVKAEVVEPEVPDVVAPEVVDNGFTPIVASDDTITVYVSSSQGLDSNDGFSVATPVKTLDKAFRLVRDGFPDHVLLKRGDVWVNENLSGIKSGRSEDEPAVVAFYGDSGDRPRLKTAGSTINSDGFHHVHVMGLNVEAYKLNPDDPAFDGETSANIRMVGDFNNVLFEDMKLRFVEFVIQGWNGRNPHNIHIRRSMILDKYTTGTSYTRNSRPSGIYMDSSNGLTIEESLWDHNGWNAKVPGAGANMYNHNMYISEKGNVGNNILVRNNIVTRASALGIHGRPGGQYENNFFGRNAIGLQMGYFAGPALSSGTKAYARDNVITEGLNMNRGVDSCSDASICTKAIWGLQVENLGNADVRVENNIVSNRLFEHEGYVKGIRENEDAVYTGNIVYRWDSEDQGVDQSYPDPTRTLADYNASLGGERSFEAFIEAARNRGLQEWDARYTADAVNDYIREGFGR